MYEKGGYAYSRIQILKVLTYYLVEIVLVTIIDVTRTCSKHLLAKIWNKQDLICICQILIESSYNS